MRLIKLAIIGAAVAAGITYITKKNEDGSSVLDELTENGPQWLDKAKEFASHTIDKLSSDIRS